MTQARPHRPGIASTHGCFPAAPSLGKPGSICRPPSRPSLSASAALCAHEIFIIWGWVSRGCTLALVSFLSVPSSSCPGSRLPSSRAAWSIRVPHARAPFLPVCPGRAGAEGLRLGGLAPLAFSWQLRQPPALIGAEGSLLAEFIWASLHLHQREGERAHGAWQRPSAPRAPAPSLPPAPCLWASLWVPSCPVLLPPTLVLAKSGLRLALESSAPAPQPPSHFVTQS